MRKDGKEDRNLPYNAHVFQLGSSDKAHAAPRTVRMGSRSSIMVFKCKLILEYSAAGDARISWRVNAGHLLYRFTEADYSDKHCTVSN